MTTISSRQVDRYWPAYQHIFAHKYTEFEIALISKRHRGYVRELRLQILGLSRPWPSWRPDIRLIGTIHLREALARGHGAILWVTETAFSTLIVKMALHSAGFRACQLSRPGHGFSTSPFGIRFLNPLWIRIEDRFIAERIIISGEYATEALATVRTRLAANQIVIITVVPEAHKFTEVPFFDAKLQLPTGPIRLARKTGAALIPVFAITTNNNAFEVEIQEPLDLTSDHADESSAAAYAKRLEAFISQYPDQWDGWRWLMSRMRANEPHLCAHS